MELFVFFPLFAFLFSLTHSFWTPYIRILLCLSSVALSLIISVYSFFIPDKIFVLGHWFTLGVLEVNFSFLFDPLTKIMLFVVSFISFLVHLYSLDYMREDPELPLFIAYLSLFTFFMFLLVSAANFVVLFMGWEGVGLSSYLLINFWHTRVNAQKSAIKAVIVNKIGDVLLMFAFSAIFFNYQTLDYLTIFGSVPFFPNPSFYNFPIIDIICIFLLGGAAAKSAQLCLHTWLPDAMEGPSPVSALIHAATMVTAGIFLLVRCSPLLEFSEFTLSIAATLGALTAFFAATVALCQHDIKRIIAYSTCSQLGYMLFAVGFSGYSFAMFHLFNHAFFKAALFLSAGSIIHSFAIEQDLRRMGGVSQLLPLAFVSTLCGSLSLMGFPFLSGFFSKDAILELAFSSQNSSIGFFAYVLGTISAFLTSFYSIRLLILAFLKVPNAFRSYILAIHDAPLFMAIPLIILFAPSILSGFLTFDVFFSNFWKQSILILPHHYSTDLEFLPVLIKLLPTFFSIFGAVFSFILFFYYPIWSIYKPIYHFLYYKWYFDSINNKFLVIPSLYFGRRITFETLDRGLFNLWGPEGLAIIANLLVRFNHILQNGLINDYLMVFVLGMCFVFHSIYINLYFCFEALITLSIAIGTVYTLEYLENNPEEENFD